MKFEFRSLSAAHAEIARLREALKISDSSLKALADFDGYEARDLQRQVRELTELVTGRARDILVERMNFQDGEMEAYLKHPLFGLFVLSVSEMWAEQGAKNFLEVRAFAPPPGPGEFTLTVQKVSGMTPVQQRDAARHQSIRAINLAEELSDLILRIFQSPVDPLLEAPSEDELKDAWDAYAAFRDEIRLNSQAPEGSNSQEALSK